MAGSPSAPTTEHRRLRDACLIEPGTWFSIVKPSHQSAMRLRKQALANEGAFEVFGGGFEAVVQDQDNGTAKVFVRYIVDMSDALPSTPAGVFPDADDTGIPEAEEMPQDFGIPEEEG